MWLVDTPLVSGRRQLLYCAKWDGDTGKQSMAGDCHTVLLVHMIASTYACNYSKQKKFLLLLIELCCVTSHFNFWKFIMKLQKIRTCILSLLFLCHHSSFLFLLIVCVHSWYQYLVSDWIKCNPRLLSGKLSLVMDNFLISSKNISIFIVLMEEMFNTRMHIFEQSVRKMHSVSMVALSSARLMLMGKN